MDVASESRFQQWFLLALVAIVTAAFVWLIAGFLDALFLAALSAVLLQPMQHALSVRLGGREGLAAILTLVVAVLIVGLPMLGLIGATRGRGCGAERDHDALDPATTRGSGSVADDAVAGLAAGP